MCSLSQYTRHLLKNLLHGISKYSCRFIAWLHEVRLACFAGFPASFFTFCLWCIFCIFVFSSLVCLRVTFSSLMLSLQEPGCRKPFNLLLCVTPSPVIAWLLSDLRLWVLGAVSDDRLGASEDVGGAYASGFSLFFPPQVIFKPFIWSFVNKHVMTCNKHFYLSCDCSLLALLMKSSQTG